MNKPIIHLRYDDTGIAGAFDAASRLYRHATETLAGGQLDDAYSVIFEGLSSRLRAALGDGIDDQAIDALVEQVRFMR